MLTRIAAIAAATVLTATLSACGSSSSSSSSSGSTGTVTCDYPSQSPAAKKVDPPPTTPDVSGTVTATMATNVGTIDATLDADRAPCTVNSFVSLAKQGYFDKTPCHRLTTANTGIYVLQCGDPTGTGTGGPGYTIPDELSGQEKYPAGTLAMAKTSEPNSGGSQFFIVYQDTPLPPDYTVFGQVSPASVKLVQQVAAKGTDNANGPGDGHPQEKVTIEKVTTG